MSRSSYFTSINTSMHNTMAHTGAHTHTHTHTHTHPSHPCECSLISTFLTLAFTFLLIPATQSAVTHHHPSWPHTKKRTLFFDVDRNNDGAAGCSLDSWFIPLSSRHWIPIYVWHVIELFSGPLAVDILHCFIVKIDCSPQGPNVEHC